MRIAQPDFRQPAARLYATTHRRRARPALGSDPGAGRGVNRMTRRDARGTPTRRLACNARPPCPPSRSTTSRSPSPNGAFRPAEKPAGTATA
nr:hypothetical protein [Achromobacter ruhlandii]